MVLSSRLNRFSKLFDPIRLGKKSGILNKQRGHAVCLAVAGTLLHGSVVRRRGLDGISGDPFLILGRHRAIQSEPRSPPSHPEAAAQSDELGCL
jgi:hypothetical protein